MGSLVNWIKSLVRFAVVTGPADNDSKYPVQQIKYKGKLANTLMVFPYGVYANASTEESLSLLFSVEGDTSNKAAIPYTPQLRPRDLEQNEVCFYHPFTNTTIKLRNNGNIEIDTTEENAKVLVSCNGMEIDSTGKVELSINGSFQGLMNGAFDVAANSVEISSGNNIVLDGNQVHLKGNAKDVVTTGSINPLTGLPFPNGNPNVKADA